MESKIDPEMNHEIVVEIEPEIVLEIDPEIEPAPQTPLNQSSEIEQETEQQQQTNNSIITATTPLTNNDSKVDSADRKNAPRRAMVTCLSHHKCTSIPISKKARSIRVVAAFSEIILGDLGEYSLWN
uniref:Uncharacterized protein n=1 Tax=Meloidogyne javanica TaxID=6303 RepID=A0A915MJF4_MELJA